MPAEVRVTATETSTSSMDLLVRTVQDDGSGAINGGTINYDTGAVSMPAQHTYSATQYGVTQVIAGDLQYETGAWSSSSLTETIDGQIIVRYALAETVPGETVTGFVDVPALEVPLLVGSQDQIIPGTVRFTLGSVAYSDRDGTGGLLYDAAGTVVGSMDYVRRVAVVEQWSGAGPTVTITSMISTFGQFTLQELSFRTSTAPLAPGSLQIVATEDDGDLVAADGQTDGSITGTGVDDGTVEHDIGVVAMAFDNPVYPGSIRYSATAYSIIPLDPDIIGIDPVRLPPDGRVPILRSGDYAVVYEDGDDDLPNPAVAGSTYALGSDHLAFAYLVDGAGEETYTLPSGLAPSQAIQIPTDDRVGPLEYAVLEDARARPIAGALYEVDLATWEITLAATYSGDGYEEPFMVRFLALVDTDQYEVDRTAGEITMADPLDLTGYTEPLLAVWRQHDIALVVEAQTTGTVTLQAALAHDYTTSGAVSAMLLHGDLKARIANAFEQHSDTGTWLDYLSGSAPTSGARYDFIGYPVVVANNGAIRERWRLKKRSDGSWDVIGETLGVIQVWAGTDTLNAKRSLTQEHPYFTLYHQGLGSGWATGNFIQFETYSAQAPVWVLRTVKPGAPTVATDAIRLRHRVGAD